MSAVSSSIRSSGNGGNATGFMAMDISFIGLSSAAARLEAVHRACGYDRTAAHPAGEAVVAGMRFVITLLILLAFILPIHGNSS